MKRPSVLAATTGNGRPVADADLDPPNAGSDKLVDAVVAWGDLDNVVARIKEHLAAGADHVCVQVLTSEPDPAAVSAGLKQLAAVDWA